MPSGRPKLWLDLQNGFVPNFHCPFAALPIIRLTNLGHFRCPLRERERERKKAEGKHSLHFFVRIANIPGFRVYAGWPKTKGRRQVKEHDLQTPVANFFHRVRYLDRVQQLDGNRWGGVAEAAVQHLRDLATDRLGQWSWQCLSSRWNGMESIVRV